MKVDRYLKDKAMDHIDHALGRPFDPLVESYRNYFAAGGPLADELAASPHWTEGRQAAGGLRCFAVNDLGRKALADHLKAIGDPHRAYSVAFDGHAQTVVAASRTKARYSRYLDLIDVMPDLKFKDFCRRASVNVAARKARPAPDQIPF
jgi:hypothetical protein